MKPSFEFRPQKPNGEQEPNIETNVRMQQLFRTVLQEDAGPNARIIDSVPVTSESITAFKEKYRTREDFDARFVTGQALKAQVEVSKAENPSTAAGLELEAVYKQQMARKYKDLKDALYS